MMRGITVYFEVILIALQAFRTLVGYFPLARLAASVGFSILFGFWTLRWFSPRSISTRRERLVGKRADYPAKQSGHSERQRSRRDSREEALKLTAEFTEFAQAERILGVLGFSSGGSRGP